jgi:hypothetical protein
MSEIVVDFLLGPDWSSQLISWWGQGYGGYSHAAGLLSTGMYVDARLDGGVKVRDPKAEKWKRKTRASLSVSITEYSAWERALLAKLGDPYGQSDIIAFITGREDKAVGHWICSALQIETLQEINRVPSLPVKPHQVTPNSLLLIMAAVGFEIEDIAA